MSDINNDTTRKLLLSFSQFRKLSFSKQLSMSKYKPSEIKLLISLKHGSEKCKEGMMVSELSKYLRVTSPTVTQLANNLERNGLILRVFDPNDRRIVRIKLTEKGMTIVNRAEAEFYEMLNGLINYLGKDDSEKLAELLLKVYNYFDTIKTSS